MLKEHDSSPLNAFLAGSSGSRSELHSRRSCEEEKNEFTKMTWEVIRKVTAVSACTGHEGQRKLQSGTMHWPRLSPLRRGRAPCRLHPLSLLNPGPPSVSAVSICILPHWNKVMWQNGVMCCHWDGNSQIISLIKSAYLTGWQYFRMINRAANIAATETKITDAIIPGWSLNPAWKDKCIQWDLTVGWLKSP